MRERERLAGRKAPGTTDPAGTIPDEGDEFWKEGLDEREGDCSPAVRERQRRRRRRRGTGGDTEETLERMAMSRRVGWIRGAQSPF